MRIVDATAQRNGVHMKCTCDMELTFETARPGSPGGTSGVSTA
jgi:hypothetical protein